MGSKVDRRVYVGNLPFYNNRSQKLSWQDLKDHMRTCGEVTYCDLAIGEDGRLKGWGLVEYSTPASAATACEQLNNSQLNGRSIQVRPDKEDTGSIQSVVGAIASGQPRTLARGNSDRRVHVSNLSWRTQWWGLKDHFKEFQPSHCEVIEVARPNGGMGSAGWGLVELSSAENVGAAVFKLDGSNLEGRTIRVKPDDGGKNGRRVYVGNLPFFGDDKRRFSWQDLKDHMKTCGQVTYCDLMLNAEGRSKGCGLVEYSSAEEAAAAVKDLTDTALGGRKIFVRADREGGTIGEWCGDNRAGVAAAAAAGGTATGKGKGKGIKGKGIKGKGNKGKGVKGNKGKKGQSNTDTGKGQGVAGGVVGQGGRVVVVPYTQ